MKPYLVTETLTTDDLTVMSIQALEFHFSNLCKLNGISHQRLNEIMDIANRLADFVEREEAKAAIDYFPDIGKAWR